jgi:hypothetical protein
MNRKEGLLLMEVWMNPEQRLRLRKREVLHVIAAKNLGIVLMIVKWFCVIVVRDLIMPLRTALCTRHLAQG